MNDPCNQQDRTFKSIPLLAKETLTSFSRESKRRAGSRWTWRRRSPSYFPTADMGLSSVGAMVKRAQSIQPLDRIAGPSPACPTIKRPPRLKRAPTRQPLRNKALTDLPSGEGLSADMLAKIDAYSARRRSVATMSPSSRALPGGGMPRLQGPPAKACDVMGTHAILQLDGPTL